MPGASTSRRLSTSATQFPYAIGLYLFAAPFSIFTHDYVALLRVVVCASEAIAGALLYLMIVRTRGDRIMGAMAVPLFNMVPLSYVIVGNANLTHAFGQAVALATIAAATIWPPEPRHVGRLVALVLLAVLGFIAHISTLMLLLAMLLVLAFFYRVLGGASRASAASLVLATAIAAVLSVALYWGHFGQVYQAQIARARAIATSAPESGASADASPRAPAPATTAGPALGRRTIPLRLRAVDALRQTLDNIGWPILVLALVGAWRLWAEGGRDRLVCALAAWIVVGLAFVGVSVLAAGEMRYQQDAWEFIARVEHTTCPALVVLGAAGATWAWRGGIVLRLASCALLLAAVVIGVRAWAGWI